MTVNGSDLSMTRGDSESLSVVLKNAVFSEGDLITFTVRKTPTSEIVLQKVVSEFTDEDTRATIIIDSGDTEGLDFGKYYYDIQLTRAGGIITTIIKPARFTLDKEVTY